MINPSGLGIYYSPSSTSDYVYDEYAGLDGRGHVHPFPTALSIRQGADNRATRYPAEALGSRPGVTPLPVGVVLLTRYRAGARWLPCRPSSGRAVLALLGHTRAGSAATESRDQQAAERLGRAHLLSEPVRLPAAQARTSRREAMRTLGLGAGLALLLPVVETIVAPHAEAQASCLAEADCLLRLPPFCSIYPHHICLNPQDCCMEVVGVCEKENCD